MSEDKKPNKPEDDFQWGKIAKQFILLSGVLIVFLVLFQNFIEASNKSANLKYFKVLEQLAADGKVKSLVYYEKTDTKPAMFKGEFIEPLVIPEVNKGNQKFQFFEVNAPVMSHEELQALSRNVNIEFKSHEPGFMDVFVYLLPWILIIGLFVLFTRRMQSGLGGGKSGGGGGLFSIGKIKAQMLTKDEVKTTFKDVSGADEAKVELEEVIDFLKSPQKYQKLGGRIPKGVLLTGPPGTGKTLLAKAVAGEAGVPFFSISGSDFVEMFVGVGASRVRDLFEQGRKHAPCIIFIDEIDAVGRQRGVGLGGGNDEREQTLNALLVEMDGFDAQEGVIIMAATNRPDVLDSALMRPGRFDRRIVVERPDLKGRKGILEVHTRNVPLGEDVDLDRLAMGTPGFSGADIANLVNEAALLAARYDKKAVDMDDFELAKDKVILGLERKSLVMKEEDRLATAYHESGHTILGKLIEDQDPVYKVTIIPRGFALGVTWSMPKDDMVTQSKEFLEGKIAMMLGGRVAEKIKFGHLSSGAGNDLQQASEIARRMVTQFGMSDKIGPVYFNTSSQDSFTKAFSEKTAEEIDKEVRRIITDQEKRADKILRDNISILDTMADELVKRETLVADEIDKIIAGEELPEYVKKVRRTDRERLAEIEKVKEDKKEEQNDDESEDHSGLEGNEVPVV
jgi:cell division protease FtsH